MELPTCGVARQHTQGRLVIDETAYAVRVRHEGRYHNVSEINPKPLGRKFIDELRRHARILQANIGHLAEEEILVLAPGQQAALRAQAKFYLKQARHAKHPVIKDFYRYDSAIATNALRATEYTSKDYALYEEKARELAEQLTREGRMWDAKQTDPPGKLEIAVLATAWSLAAQNPDKRITIVSPRRVVRALLYRAPEFVHSDEPAIAHVRLASDLTANSYSRFDGLIAQTD